MLKKIPTSMLRIGMYVNLSLPWHSHGFLKNKFTLVSDAQIIKIRAAGLAEVTIDTDKGLDLLKDADATAPPGPAEPQAAPPLALDALSEAVHDKTLPAPEKAHLVHDRSIVMMQQLLDNPSSASIKAAKKGIAEVVSMILDEDATTHHLLQITSHDFYTYTHSVTVGILGVALAKRLFQKSDGHDLNELGTGFFLHDLGKVHIDNAILAKPGPLTEEEMKEIRRHPALGFKLLSETKQLTEECRQIVLYHHEREDGSGYPKGLKGDEIHIYARICTIADVYDALTSCRPYRKTLGPFGALQLMREEMINHFKQDLFEQFVMMFR